MNQVFTYCNEKDEIYPLKVKEIVEAQKADAKLKHFFKTNTTLETGLELQIIEDQKCICNKGRLFILKLYCNGVQSCGITTIFSTQGTLVLKRQ